MSPSASPADRTRRFLERVAPGAATTWADMSIEIAAESWTSSAETAAALLTTLLLRLDEFAPTVHLCVPAGRNTRLPRLGDDPLIEALRNEHAGFRSVERLSASPAAAPAVRFVLGGSHRNGISLDIGGWRCGLAAETGACDGQPVASAFTAVLAANEVLQQMLRPFTRVRPFRGLVSLWDLAVDGANGPDGIDVIDLNGVAFAACGGVASATGWTLALYDLTGAPRLVDPDAIDDEGTNLNRHLTASFGDIGEPKAELLATLLDAAGAHSEVRVGRWASGASDAIEVVVVSPDHDAVRRQVQLDLPRVVLAGGTGDQGTYQVASHRFDTYACACCLWRGDLTDRSPLDGVARALGLDRSRLEPLLESGQPLPDDVLASIEDEAVRSSVSGVPGTELVEHVCATIRVAPAAPAVSAPMLAASPGVLLATELIKEQLGAPTPLRTGKNTLVGSALAGPHTRWVSTRSKRPGCECTDDVYVEHYKQKWPAGGGPASRSGADH